MGFWGDMRKALGGQAQNEEPQRFPDEFKAYEERILRAREGSTLIPADLSERITGTEGSAARREWARSSFNQAIKPIQPSEGNKPDPELLQAIDAVAIKHAIHLSKPIGEAMERMRAEITGQVHDLVTRPAELDENMRTQADGLVRGSWSEQKRDQLLGSDQVLKSPIPNYSLDEGASRRRWGEESLLLRSEAARAGFLTPDDLVAVASHTAVGRDTSPIDPRTIGADFVRKPPQGRQGPDPAYLQQVSDDTLRKRFSSLPGVDAAAIPTDGGERKKWIDSSLRGLQIVEHVEKSNPALASRLGDMRRDWAVPSTTPETDRAGPSAPSPALSPTLAARVQAMGVAQNGR